MVACTRSIELFLLTSNYKEVAMMCGQTCIDKAKLPGHSYKCPHLPTSEQGGDQAFQVDATINTGRWKLIDSRHFFDKIRGHAIVERNSFPKVCNRLQTRCETLQSYLVST